MKITLNIFKHRGLFQIGIRFPFDEGIWNYIKNYESVQWTATFKCFYIQFTEENYSNFLTYLRTNAWEINTTAVTDFLATKHRRDMYKLHYEGALVSFKEWMVQKRYSDNTINTYTSLLKVFFMYYYDKEIQEINEKDVIHFNRDYILGNSYSASFQNQIISAIKIFYKINENKHMDLEHLERPIKSKSLPEVLSIEEVGNILYAVSNLKHKVLLGLIYSAGLRIGEALHIKLKDVDSDRMMLRIEMAKGNKDRYVPLSPKLLILLREYYKLNKPKYYLFEGVNGGKYSQSSSRAVLRKAVWIVGIKKRVTLHTLRHSYATHLLESGTDIRLIQELLGHNSPKTTMLYTHISSKKLGSIKSPYDDLDI